ncbi:MAG: methyltransferase family protein [Candidatus Helarchaeota archaeon]
MGENEEIRRIDITHTLGTGAFLIVAGVPYSIIVVLVNIYLFPSLKFVIGFGMLNLVLGTGLMLTGAIIWILSVKKIKVFMKTGELCTDGIYKYIRHPLYCAIIILFIPGVVIISELLLPITIPIFGIILFHFGIQLEENGLIERFGDEYKEYASRVKRIIPRIY